MNVFNGNFIGLSDSPYAGVEGSFSKCVGVDGHSVPGVLKVCQRLIRTSGSTVDELCKVALSCSDGSSLWFSSESGKIWRREDDNVWTLVHTTSPSSGDAYCLGAEEYDGYIYWATEEKLHRKPVTDLSDWSDATEDWATFDIGNEEFHPMIVQNDLIIGDSNVIAKVSNSTGSHVFADVVKTLIAPLKVKTFLDFDIDVLIGTYISDTVNKAQVLRWDTTSDNLFTSDAVDENGVNAFIRDGNNVYVQCGKFGSIYLYDGQELQAFKRIPGEYSSTASIQVHPNSVSSHMTIPVFGVSNISGNPTEQGLYRLGSYGSSYTKALDLSFPVSAGSLSGIEIGAILSLGADLLVSWADSDESAIDALDWNSKYGSAYIETTLLSTVENRSELKSINEVIANYSSLPTGTGINFSSKKKNEANFSDLPSATDDDLQQEKSSLAVVDVANFQGRIDFVVSGNEGPEIDSIIINDNTDV